MLRMRKLFIVNSSCLTETEFSCLVPETKPKNNEKSKNGERERERESKRVRKFYVSSRRLFVQVLLSKNFIKKNRK